MRLSENRYKCSSKDFSGGGFGSPTAVKMWTREMFRAEGVPLPPFQKDAMIIISSLTPQNTTQSLSFEDMHKMKYKELRTDLHKVLSPKKPNLTPIKMKMKSHTHERKKQMENIALSEPTLYHPSPHKEFSLSSQRRTISPSELVLLREQHARKLNQVELNATSFSSSNR
jgi:hypothetical protein